MKEYHYFWKHTTFFKNQVLYKQGQPCDMVYLIETGDFEQYVNLNANKTDRELKIEQLNGPQRQHTKTIRIDMDKNKSRRVFIA